jgi:hypothetical protein
MAHHNRPTRRRSSQHITHRATAPRRGDQSARSAARGAWPHPAARSPGKGSLSTPCKRHRTGQNSGTHNSTPSAPTSAPSADDSTSTPTGAIHNRAPGRPITGHGALLRPAGPWLWLSQGRLTWVLKRGPARPVLVTRRYAYLSFEPIGIVAGVPCVLALHAEDACRRSRYNAQGRGTRHRRRKGSVH